MLRFKEKEEELDDVTEEERDTEKVLTLRIMS